MDPVPAALCNFFSHVPTTRYTGAIIFTYIYLFLIILLKLVRSTFYIKYTHNLLLIYLGKLTIII